MTLSTKIDQMRNVIINSTQDIIRIRSIQGEPRDKMPFGIEVNAALEFMLNLSNNLGFNTVNLDGYVGYAEYGTGDEYICVLGHLDVVPEGEGWNYPPFAAEIHDGKIYGRGTMDDKSPMISSLYGLKAIRELNLPLKRKIRIIFGTNEETGCNDMPYYNARSIPPLIGFTPDGHYPIVFAEKGITVFDLTKELNVTKSSLYIKNIKGGQYANMVPGYAEAELHTEAPYKIAELCNRFSTKEVLNLSTDIKGTSVIVKSYGVSAHGSTPELGKNAIIQLFKFLNTLSFEKDDLYYIIEFFNDYIGFETNGKALGINLQDEVSGSLSLNVGAVNMQENKITLKLNIRYPVESVLEDMLVPLNEKLETTGLEINNLWHKAPLYFPRNHKLISTLSKVYTEETGLAPELLSIGMGTYAKEIPNIVAFGPILPGREDLDHKADENIEIEDLILNTKIYAKAIYELANLES